MLDNSREITMSLEKTEHGVSVLDSPIRATAGATMVYSLTANQTPDPKDAGQRTPTRLETKRQATRNSLEDRMGRSATTSSLEDQMEISATTNSQLFGQRQDHDIFTAATKKEPILSKMFGQLEGQRAIQLQESGSVHQDTILFIWKKRAWLPIQPLILNPFATVTAQHVRKNLMSPLQWLFRVVDKGPDLSRRRACHAGKHN